MTTSSSSSIDSRCLSERVAGFPCNLTTKYFGVLSLLKTSRYNRPKRCFLFSPDNDYDEPTKEAMREGAVENGEVNYFEVYNKK